jgi:hypothetical protein
MIEAVPFRAEHGHLAEHLHEHAVTVLDGETVLGITGAGQQDGDAVELWLIVTDEGRARPLSLCRAAKKFVEEMLMKHERIKVRAEGKTHRRFAEHLGFVFTNGVGEL